MKRTIIPVKRKTAQSYTIVIGDDCLKKLIVDIKTKKWANRYAIITDSKVKKLYGEKVQKILKKAGIETVLISFIQGEKHKNFKTVQTILDSLFKEEFHRDDGIIALGGGVVGDIAGFVASLYMRGIPYIQIPTTLLAMVDSSVGGKTGVDTKWGKNLIGSFYNPKAVYIKPSYLQTLPKKQLRNGFSEIIKYGIIARPSLLTFLQKNKESLFAAKTKATSKLIAPCVRIKRTMVQVDERENGMRKLLNYGHTIGHAIEKQSHYTVQHGQAISIGMSIINTIAVSKKWMSKKNAETIKKLFKTYGLPTKLPTSFSNVALVNSIKMDKKIKHNKKTFVVATKLGKARLSTSITNQDITKACRKHA
ncbi:3-dehydroquinate synthase [Candidatus Peregrinibacteria bacterium]|nr:3-dehydroquinate synthase [Candidatus Peregrinibacteria bacterium]